MSPPPPSPTPSPSLPSPPSLPPQPIHQVPFQHIPRIRPIHNFGYYPRYYDDWRWRPSVYVLSSKDDNREGMNYLPLVLVGGISVIALIVALQKK
jgi:hypothetical protein